MVPDPLNKGSLVMQLECVQIYSSNSFHELIGISLWANSPTLCQVLHHNQLMFIYHRKEPPTVVSCRNPMFSFGNKTATNCVGKEELTSGGGLKD